MSDGRRPCPSRAGPGVRELLVPASASAAQHVVDDDRRGVPERRVHRDRRRGRRGGAAVTRSPSATAAYLRGRRRGRARPRSRSTSRSTLRGAGAGRGLRRADGRPRRRGAEPARRGRQHHLRRRRSTRDISGITVFGANRHVEAGVAYLNADGKVSSVEIVDLVRRRAVRRRHRRRLLRLGQRGRPRCARSTLEDSLVEGYDAAGVVVDAALANGTSRTSSATFGLFALLNGNRVTGAGARRRDRRPGRLPRPQPRQHGGDRERVHRQLRRGHRRAELDQHVADALQPQQHPAQPDRLPPRGGVRRLHAGPGPHEPLPARRDRRTGGARRWARRPTTSPAAATRPAARSPRRSGCTATAGCPTRPTASTSGDFLTRPAPVPTPLGAFHDAQPTVSITAPAPGTKLGAGRAGDDHGDRSDDIGVHDVTFLRGDQVLAVDARRRTRATYTPQGEEAWTAQSIVAMATDSRGQSGGDAVSVGASDDAAPTSSCCRPERRAGGGYALYRDRRPTTAASGRSRSSSTASSVCVDRHGAVHAARSPRSSCRAAASTVVAIATDTAGQTSTDIGDAAAARPAQAARAERCSADAGRRERVRRRPAPAARAGSSDRDGCARQGRGDAAPARRGRRPRAGASSDRDCRYDATLRGAGATAAIASTARFLGNDVLRPVSAEPSG